MELTEGEIIEKYAKRCLHYSRNTLLPYEYDFTCVSGGYNVIKRKHELSKIQGKKINFINRLKYAEHKIFCIGVDVYKIYEGIDYNKIYQVLSILEMKKKLKIKDFLTEKFKDMLKNPNFDQGHCSRTAQGIYKIGHDSFRLMKWLIHYHRSFFDNLKYFDLMGFICNYKIDIVYEKVILNEIS